MPRLSASCSISAFRSVRPILSARPSSPGASVNRSVISTRCLTLASAPKRLVRSLRSIVPPRIHSTVSTVVVDNGKPPSLISALDISSRVRCEAGSRVKIIQSSSCSSSAFLSAHRNVDLPLSVGPSMATPDWVPFIRYATSGSLLLDHRERDGLRCHAQAQIRRETFHIHRIINRGRSLPAELLPHPAPALGIAERAEGNPRQAVQPSEFRHPVHPAGAGNNLVPRVEPRWVGRPPARSHDHRPLVRCRQALAHKSEGAFKLRRPQVLSLVHPAGDESAQCPGAKLRLGDEFLKPVNALLQSVAAAAYLNQAYQVHCRLRAQLFGHKAIEVVPGPAAAAERNWQPLEPNLPGPGQHGRQDVGARGTTAA